MIRISMYLTLSGLFALGVSPWEKTLRFLAQRRTLKPNILAAVLKLFDRTTAPINKPNLLNPRESISSSVLGYLNLEFERALPYFLIKNICFLCIWVLCYYPNCFKSFCWLFVPKFLAESVS